MYVWGKLNWPEQKVNDLNMQTNFFHIKAFFVYSLKNIHQHVFFTWSALMNSVWKQFLYLVNFCLLKDLNDPLDNTIEKNWFLLVLPGFHRLPHLQTGVQNFRTGISRERSSGKLPSLRERRKIPRSGKTFLSWCICHFNKYIVPFGNDQTSLVSIFLDLFHRDFTLTHYFS